MSSAAILRHCREHPARQSRVFDALFTQLDEAAQRAGRIVISAETFGRSIALQEEDFTTYLDDLGTKHELRIAYYVRPQHRSLESSWRHWRSDREIVPSKLIARLNRELHHINTMRFVEAAAPHATFTPRPCRQDLLPNRDVVSDFVRTFLAADVDEGEASYRENRGIPLEIATALSSMPSTELWPPEQDHGVLEMIKDLVESLDEQESRLSSLARLVLQQACHEYFEPGNLEMISQLGWETKEWVPVVDADIGEASFERMNELWLSGASRREIAFLHHTLAALWDTRKAQAETRRLRRELDHLQSRRSVRAAVRASSVVHGLIRDPRRLRRPGRASDHDRA